MSGNTQRQAWYAGAHRPGKLDIPFGWAVTLVIAAGLLWGGSQAIVLTRSVKYLVAYVIAGLLASGFLMLRRKHDFLLTCVGLSVPFEAGIILIDRGVILSITGTLVVIVLLAAVGFATGTMGKSNLLLEPSISAPMVLFLCACLLSFVSTSDRTASVIAFVRETEMFVVFLVLINAIRESEQLLSFLRGLYWGFTIECLIYVIQNITGVSFDIVGNTHAVGATNVDTGYIASQRGTFGEAPATAALYFSICTLLLTGVYLCRKKIPVGLKILPAMGMGVACLALAAKRAPWMGFALGISALTFLLWKYSRTALRRFGRVLGVVAAAALVLLPVILLRASADHEGAYEERKNLTRIAWRMYEAHPVFGIGIGNYDFLKRQYLPEEWVGWIYTVHNRFLLFLAETGTVGEIFLLFLYGSILVAAYRGIRRVAEPYRPFQMSIVAALVAMYWEMNWDIFDSLSQGYIFWLVAAMAAILPRVLAKDNAPEQR